jgi:predicted secreted Zn-dependent protease
LKIIERLFVLNHRLVALCLLALAIECSGKNKEANVTSGIQLSPAPKEFTSPRTPIFTTPADAAIVPFHLNAARFEFRQKSSQPKVRIRYHYYPISGSNAVALRSQMSQSGPISQIEQIHYDAKTDWYVRSFYNFAMTGNQCTIKGATANVDILFTLPKWTPPSGASRSLLTQWQQYMTALQVHENGHKQHGIEAGQEVVQTLMNLPAATSCQTLKSIANSAIQKTIKRYNQKDIDYDEITKHGLTQGAVFPPVAT